jgi:glutamine synthetase
MTATFMPRPQAYAESNGLHINFSLWRDGRNVFFDPHAPADQMRLSQTALGFIAGVLRHLRPLNALTNPTVNSYKRLMPGIIAGYWANWGLDNRISTMRVPGERGEATRIENRMPCGSANVYLAAAAMLNAALLGVVDGLDCGEPQRGDGDTEPNTDRHTPHTLADALAAFEALPP